MRRGEPWVNAGAVCIILSLGFLGCASFLPWWWAPATLFAVAGLAAFGLAARKARAR